MQAKLRRNSWIVTVPLAAIALAYILLIFLPDRRAIGKTRDQIKQKQAFVVQAVSVGAALRTVEQELKKTEAYNATWQEHAPAEGELSALYGEIHELAKAAGTTITRFDPEPAACYGEISQIPLGIGCVGSFAEICGFLRGLERLPVAIWVSELVLAASGDTGRSVICKADLVIFTHNSENSDYAGQSQ